MPNVFHVPDAPQRSRAMIFDFDGTLHRSDELQSQLHAAFVNYASHAMSESPESIERLMADFRSESPRPGELAFLIANKVSVDGWLDVASSFESEASTIKISSTVLEALSAATAYFRLALTSNSPWPLLRAVLTGAGARNLFDIIACPRQPDQLVEFPELGKPSSELYMSILRSFAVEPAHAVVVGDRHQIDIEPAQAAGIRGVLVTPDCDLADLVMSELDRARQS